MSERAKNKEDTMIIIAGHTEAKDVIARDAAVAGFAAMVEKARQQDGCLDFSISADSVDEKRVNLFERWRDEQALKAWRKKARGPRVAPTRVEVSLYRAEQAEKPF